MSQNQPPTPPLPGTPPPAPNVQSNPHYGKPPREPRKTGTPVIVWIIVGIAVASVIAAIVVVIVLRNSGGSHYHDRDVVSESVVIEESEVAVEAPQSQQAPGPEGEMAEGRGGYDDNAEGYFSQYADSYMNSSRCVNFDGSFSTSSESYPITLKFELDDNYYPRVCHYHNVNYDVDVTLSVRFTQDMMILSGNAGGSNFVISLYPSGGGNWSGNARNGNHTLSADIYPERRQ